MYCIYSNKQTCHKSTVWVQGGCLQRKQSRAMRSWDEWCKLRVDLFHLQKIKFKLHNVGTKIMVHEINSSHMTLICEIDEDDLTSKKTFSWVSLSLCHDFYLKMLWFGLNLQKDKKFGRKFFRTKFFVTLVTQSLPYSFLCHPFAYNKFTIILSFGRHQF